MELTEDKQNQELGEKMLPANCEVVLESGSRKDGVVQSPSQGLRLVVRNIKDKTELVVFKQSTVVAYSSSQSVASANLGSTNFASTSSGPDTNCTIPDLWLRLRNSFAKFDKSRSFSIATPEARLRGRMFLVITVANSKKDSLEMWTNQVNRYKKSLAESLEKLSRNSEDEEKIFEDLTRQRNAVCNFAKLVHDNRFVIVKTEGVDLLEARNDLVRALAARPPGISSGAMGGTDIAEQTGNPDESSTVGLTQLASPLSLRDRDSKSLSQLYCPQTFTGNLPASSQFPSERIENNQNSLNTIISYAGSLFKTLMSRVFASNELAAAKVRLSKQNTVTEQAKSKEEKITGYKEELKKLRLNNEKKKFESKLKAVEDYLTQQIGKHKADYESELETLSKEIKVLDGLYKKESQQLKE